MRTLLVALAFLAAPGPQADEAPAPASQAAPQDLTPREVELYRRWKIWEARAMEERVLRRAAEEKLELVLTSTAPRSEPADTRGPSILEALGLVFVGLLGGLAAGALVTCRR